MPSSAAFIHWCRLVGLALSLAGPLLAEIPVKPFTDSLSQETRKTIGLEKLSAEQLATLNEQIGREITLARQGNVKGFAKTFSQRRKEADLESTGLAKLSDDQRKELDRSIAWAMAVPLYVNRDRLAPRSEILETVKPLPRITGETSVMVGAGSGGRSVYGGSMAMTYKNPDRDITTTVRYSEFHGDRWLVDDYYYGYPFGYEFSGTQRSISIGVQIGK